MESFNKIIGYEAVKKELYQIIDMFKNKELYEKMGAKLPRGVLIYGEPGVGKTMLAEALIKECDVKTFCIKNKVFDRELIREINNAFASAANEEKAIIFLDDLDKYCEEDEENYDSRVFVTIQSNIDSVKNKDILIVATVNNQFKLPESLRRNGRFDRKLGLKAPNNEDAAKIIEFYLKQKNISKDLNFQDVAKMINYTSCASLETIINESAIFAAYERKPAIDINDIIKVYVRDQYSSPDEEYQCSKEEVEKTALHEAAHAVVAEVLKPGSVGFITIQAESANNMRGFTHMCENINKRMDNVLVALAGKIACEQFYEGRVASGCVKDLNKAISLLRSGINSNGRGGYGLIDLSVPHFSTMSEQQNVRTEAVIEAELERCSYIVKDILIKNKDFLMNLTAELKAKRSLVFSDIQRIKSAVPITNYVA